MKLTIALMPEGPVGEVVELARLAEQLGYHRCWVYDEGLTTRDVWVTLAAVAGATSSILVGPGITNPFVRHPGATATALATVDELSGGRAFLGLGAGGGLTLGPLAIERRQPVRAVADMVATLRPLLAGEVVDHDGPGFGFRGARLDYGRPGTEIILAGRGPRMLALGGGVADGFHLSFTWKPLLGEHVAALRAANAAEGGGRPFTISYATMIVTDEAQLEQARAALSFRLVDSPPEVRAALGMTDADVAAIRAALATGGPPAAARHVHPDWVPQFVIAGTPAQCAAELGQLMADHGIDEFQLPLSTLHHAGDALTTTARLFPH